MAENRKRDKSSYESYLNRTCQTIKGQSLLFFSDDQEFITKLEALCNKYSITLFTVVRKIKELKGADHASAVTNNCKKMALSKIQFTKSWHKEKGTIHYHRDFEKPVDEVLTDLNTIWLSKIPLVLESISLKKDYDNYAWIDVSFSRFDFERSNWNIRKLEITKDKIQHYKSPMTFYGKALPINASFLIGSRVAWNTLNLEYQKCLAKLIEIPYAIDEEVVLAEVRECQPSLFLSIGQAYSFKFPASTIILWYQKKVFYFLKDRFG